MNSQLTHNQTYAYRLPPTVIEQAHGYASYLENALFSDKETGGIGNSAFRYLVWFASNRLPSCWSYYPSSHSPLASAHHL